MLAKRRIKNYNSDYREQFEKMRGGSWHNASQSGLFNLNLNNSRSLATNDIGFRSALDCSSFINVYGQEIAVITKESISIPTREKID